jgi:hypothetical protein
MILNQKKFLRDTNILLLAKNKMFGDLELTDAFNF